MILKLLLFLAVGTVLMAIPLMFMRIYYGVSKCKTVLLSVILTSVGTIGTVLMYYVENQYFGGISFYGAVFFVPIMFLVIAPILGIPYYKVMDFCAVGECIMLALMKIRCMMGDCCIGRILFKLSDGSVVRFPSRITEMIVAIILFIILFGWVKKNKNIGMLYPWYMLMYGCTRFVLNILREAWVEKEMLLPFGNIWSLVSIVSGIVWLSVTSKKNSDYAEKEDIE